MQDVTQEIGEARQVSARAAGNGVRKRRALIVLMVLLLVGAGVGVPYYLHSRLYETTDDAFIEGHLVAISTRVAGHVAKVHVKDNQEVKKGDVLVELDAADYEARVAQAKGALEATKARFTAATGGTDVIRTTSGAGL